MSTLPVGSSTAVIFSSGARRTTRAAADLAFRNVVEQARHPIFFSEYGVPDTLDGRFELVCLHAFLYLHRLKSERPLASPVCQAFFDRMFADFDSALREMGTSDLRVGKHIKRMAQAFYGRIRAYEEGLAGDDSLLDAALARNLFGTVCDPPPTGTMAAYMRQAASELHRQPTAELLAGCISFPAHDPGPAVSAPGGSR